ncbi:hypothetical protein [Clostridium sp. D33t1_170424_F3]|uniref:hypothetical protein n=1 Tax=Clostridium sp. D33t1_170424_F3 TaxID=2787099 RepID=UPI0018AC6CFE|nr:hypothetical protein [Clostridium sp. D33t1_170424_F3]
MIILNKNWTFSAKGEDTVLGYVGENIVHTLQIQVLGTEYWMWNIVLETVQNEKRNIWAVEKTVVNGNLLLSVPVKKEYLLQNGTILAQLRASASDGRIKKSAKLGLSVKSSINAPDVLPSPLPSEFADYEMRIINAKSAVEADANRAAKAARCSPKIGENGNWYAWNDSIEGLQDTGIAASGAGMSKEEIKEYVESLLGLGKAPEVNADGTLVFRAAPALDYSGVLTMKKTPEINQDGILLF